jgi:hypothetical protein
MLNYVIKTALLSAALLLPVTILAASCDTGNTDCVFQERQLESIKKAGIEPIKTIEVSPASMTDTKKDQSKTIAPIQAFEIPAPITVKPKKPKSYLNLDTTPSEQDKSTSENQQETDSSSDTTTGGSTTTTTTAPSRQQTGIQYR